MAAANRGRLATASRVNDEFQIVTCRVKDRDAAVGKGQRLLTKRLIDLGANVNVSDSAGKAPLAIAIERGDQNIIDLLERFGARVASPEPAQ